MSQYSLVPAKVISNATNTPDNLMTIDKGSKDGIEEGMGVVWLQTCSGIIQDNRS